MLDVSVIKLRLFVLKLMNFFAMKVHSMRYLLFFNFILKGRNYRKFLLVHETKAIKIIMNILLIYILKK
jgi:hypothetical protein